jgi:hypothetical protein
MVLKTAVFPMPSNLKFHTTFSRQDSWKKELIIPCQDSTVLPWRVPPPFPFPHNHLQVKRFAQSPGKFPLNLAIINCNKTITSRAKNLSL